jgi:ATP-dependent DNA helicase RecG
MPTALETLVKILKQERESGCENKTVIGGLGAYSENWQRQAKEQAKRPEHFILADELVSILRIYDSGDKKERLSRIVYMLDRITGRIPVPQEYQAQLEQLREQMAQNPPATTTTPNLRPPHVDRTDKRQQSERPERREKPARSNPEASEEGEHPKNERRERPERLERLDKLERPERTARSERPERLEKPERPERKRSNETAPESPRLANPLSKPERKPRPERPERREKPPRQMRSLSNDDMDDDLDELSDRPNLRHPDRRGGESIPRESARELIEFDLKVIEGGELDVKPLPKLARPPRQKRQLISPEEAQQRLNELKESVTKIKGIGDKVAKSLEPMDIKTIEDLIYYLPRRYDDYTQLRYINRLEVDRVATVIGMVKNPFVRAGQNGRKDFIINLEDGSGRLQITFFGMYYLQNVLREGIQIVVSGRVKVYRNIMQMSNPEWEVLDSENLHTVGIVPVYRLAEGIKARSFRRTMKDTVFAWADRVPDYIPQSTLERSELADLGWALKQLHFPEGFDHLHHAQRRRVFDELLILQLGIMANRRDWQGVPGVSLEVSDGFLESFLASAFPYEMTGAQNRAIMDIRNDVNKRIPMNRLVQGDVGAGKTAVAITAMAMAVANGKQAAIMAPTSILAEQHYRAVSKAFADFPAEQRPVIGLLIGALSKSEHDAIHRGLADGSIDVIVGTHALIQAGVEFKDLAVAVVDEQHRFGVEQRARLRGKGYNPHLLVMTATPIPRTLALTMYADLDLTIIDEKPKGRQPIQTQIYSPRDREAAYRFVETQLKEDRQAFIVHPLVEASEKIDARSAIEAFEELQQVFYKHKVCLLHGRMKASEKDEVMRAFSRHEYDVMVTTSVAEVGVDIPNASVMVIESANRFGLAQLHQFRGRVGRGEHKSYCLLVVDGDVFEPRDLELSLDNERRETWSEVQERLLALRDSDDGFKLAEIDWKLRGAGDLLGQRQSGTSTLQLAEMMTPDLVALAQREARTIYEEDPDLALKEHHLLRQMVQMALKKEGDVS